MIAYYQSGLINEHHALEAFFRARDGDLGVRVAHRWVNPTQT